MEAGRARQRRAVMHRGRIEAERGDVPRWYSSLIEIEEQVTRWTTSRDQAQRALDGHIAEAERLLSAEAVTSSAKGSI